MKAKMLIIMLLVILLPVSLYAEIHGRFEVGNVIENEWAYAEIELQWWVGKGSLKNELYGGWQTWFVPHDLCGAPFKDVYFLGNRIHLRKFYFEIEHFCNHPVYSYYNRYWWTENVSNRGDLTTVSIGVKW